MNRKLFMYIVVLIISLLYVLNNNFGSIYANVINIAPSQIQYDGPPKKDFDKMTLEEQYYEIWLNVDNPWKVEHSKVQIYTDVLKKMKAQRLKELEQLKSNTGEGQKISQQKTVKGISIGSEARDMKLESINNDLKFIDKTLSVFKHQMNINLTSESINKSQEQDSEQRLYLYTLAAISFAILGIICVLVIKRFRQ